MKFRLISDLHLDINHKYPLEYTDDMFTVICGDICGNYKQTIEYINRNFKKGVFIEGNHIAYDSYTIDEANEELSANFGLDDDMTYLNNTHKVVDDVVFVGATLWTDFEFGGGEIGLNMRNALDFMNDYRYNHILIKEDFVNGQRKVFVPPIRKRLSPMDTRTLHIKSLAYIKEIVKKYPDKKIVVVTHHAPSGKSIAKKYTDNFLNCAYVSDLEEFILENRNIKMWCHGHCHNSFDYMIGECRVVCNARGYVEYDPPSGFDENFTVEV